MRRLAQKFKELKRKNRCAFIAYITVGDPSLSVTKELIFELERSGVDIIELGVPFSDPLADGPVIQAASHRALKNGTTLAKIIQLIKSIRKDVRIPLCLMSYYNPIYRMGLLRFASEIERSGVDGVIVPDLPLEEAKGLIKVMRRGKIDTVFFVSPMSSIKRIKLAAKASSSFIYYVSLAGITGARKELADDLRAKVSLIKRYTTKPVCVGFGISRPQQVRELSNFCDGVIVGSAIVNKIAENLNKEDLIKNIGIFVRSLTGELRNV
ncbi:MAG: tryptophan synthase subunit alpha [Candidatus Omnitrophota bacterium]|nr:tryptophan synthase subunit alpha [Candidatus Omnitrophota bacterium]